MGLQLRIRHGELYKCFAMPMPELEIIAKFDRKAQDAAEVIFGVKEFGQPKYVKTSQLRNAIAEMQKAFDKDREYWPFTYSVEFHSPSTNQIVKASGQVGAVRRNNDGYLYYIDCGLGFCDLKRMRVNPDGRGEWLDVEDVRHLKSFLSDDAGEVRIHKKKRILLLPNMLGDIHSFISNFPDEADVEVTLG